MQWNPSFKYPKHRMLGLRFAPSQPTVYSPLDKHAILFYGLHMTLSNQKEGDYGFETMQ